MGEESESGVARGRGRAQVRRVREREWTAAKRRDFLAALTASANVSHAARSVGMSEGGAYALRRRDEGFRGEWQAALVEGYERLELMLLDRAFRGTPKTVTRADGETVTTVEFSDRLALALLSQHRAAMVRVRAETERASGGGAQMAAIVAIDADCVRAELVARLELMGLRIRGGDDVPAIEG